VSGGDAHLPEFSIEKPEVGSLWWKLCLRTATSRSQRRGTTGCCTYRLPVNVVESMVGLINTIGDYKGREYKELKRRVLTAHGHSRWEKLDSLMAFPKMGGQ
jgi:hypothetical protein